MAETEAVRDDGAPTVELRLLSIDVRCVPGVLRELRWQSSVRVLPFRATQHGSET